MERSVLKHLGLQPVLRDPNLALAESKPVMNRDQGKKTFRDMLRRILYSNSVTSVRLLIFF